MEAPQQLAALYGSYCYLMAIDPDELLHSLSSAKPAPTDGEYFKRVREFHAAASAIQRLSADCEQVRGVTRPICSTTCSYLVAAVILI
jgi:hypothetical protein